MRHRFPLPARDTIVRYAAATLMDVAFVHLGGIQSLNMRYCNQVTIKDAAFLHLRGIHNLQLRGPVRCCRCPRLGLVVM